LVFPAKVVFTKFGSIAGSLLFGVITICLGYKLNSGLLTAANDFV